MSASKHRIYHLFQLAAHRLKKSGDRAIMAAAGVTTAQAAVLAIVAGRESVTQRSISRSLGLNESAITAMTSRLCGADLLSRTPDPMDSRAWSLNLTEKGRATLERLAAPHQLINRKIEAVLSPEEIEALADYMSRLISAFEESDASAAG